MLLQFTVANFRSFRDPTTISFVRPDRPQITFARSEDVLRTVAIYGANASGKSSLVMALAAFRKLVLEGVRPEAKISRTPFRGEGAEPSRFEVEFRVNGIQLGYAIAFDSDRVLEESLVEVSSEGAETIWFSRVLSKTETGGLLHDEGKERLDFIVNSVRDNQPLLYEFLDRRVATVEALIDSIRALRIERPDDHSGRLALEYEGDVALRASALSLLLPFDPGVSSIQALRFKVPEDSKINFSAKPDPGLLDRHGLGMSVEEREFVALRLERDEHSFQFHEESDGTRRLLELVVPLSTARSVDAVLVVDEIERSLHPLMTRHLLQSWCEDGSKTGQLIFTSHDTHLLDVLARQPNFHPASVVFAEKGRDFATRFHSLAEFDPAQIEVLKSALERGYLEGRFGAVPIFSRRLAHTTPS